MKSTIVASILAAGAGAALFGYYFVRKNNSNSEHKTKSAPTPVKTDSTVSSSSSSMERSDSTQSVGTPVPDIDTSSLPERISQNYEIQEFIGKGAFSKVSKAKAKTDGTVVAIKIIDKKHGKVDPVLLRTEVTILSRLKHPNIVQLFEVQEDENYVYLVMELLSGGELFDQIVNQYPNGYNEKVAARIIEQILKAIHYVHRKGVIHRDLKPENLLCVDSQKENGGAVDSDTGDTFIKISDFGLAITNENSSSGKITGSPPYIAPEIIEKKPYTTQCDMWSIGVITYILLCGSPPFYASTTKELFAKIVEGKFEFMSPYWDKISSQAKAFVTALLEQDPEQRLTAEGALNHAWIQRYSTSPLTEADTMLLTPIQIGQSFDEMFEESPILPLALEELKKFNAKRKLTSTVRKVVVANRLKRLGSASKKATTDSV